MVRLCSSFSGPFIKSHAKAEIFVNRFGGVITLIKGEPSALSGMSVPIRHGWYRSYLTPSGILPDACPVVFRNYFGGNILRE
jgi:hypothetical protein